MDQLEATKPHEVCLIKLEPHPLQMPEIIPQQEKCKPELLNEKKMTQLWEKRSEQMRRVMTQVQRDLDSKLKFKSMHPTKPPSSKIKNCPVKLNIATKLRERALQNLKEEELQRKEKERKTSLDLRQKVVQDKNVLAEQNKPEEKQQELQRLEQIKSSKSKTAEHDDGSLVREATVLLDKFGASEQSLDAFIEEAEKDLKNMDAQHKKFILHVVSGCTEYKKLLDVVVNVFYGQNGRWLSIGDRSQFAIICYLTTFVLDDIGLQRFSNIVKSLDIKKTHTFLDFFFTHLTTWIQDEWNHIYDAACVEEQWIGPLLRWRPHIDILMDQLHLKLSRGSKFKKAQIKTTKPQEFCLTKPKPRPLPMPELIPQQDKCKPVPNSTYRAPKEMQIIKEMKHENHEKTTELLNEANMLQFSFVNRPRSERARRVMTQVQKDLDSKLQFNSKHSIKPPSSNMIENSPVKLNIAMKLREKALRNHKEEKELQRVVRLAEGGGEVSSFLQWQKKMREMELHEEMAKIEQRRLERRIGHMEAAFPPKAIIERNQKASKLKREESAQRTRANAWKKLLEEKELKDLVQQVVEEEKKPAIAREKLQNFKQRIGREVFEQSQVLRRQLLEEAQAEESRRFQTVLEIRAIESLPPVRFKYFDNTKTAGHELLDEMSIIELKLRTAHLKDYRQTEKQKRHEQILKVNQKKKRRDMEMETEYLHTRAVAQAAAIRKEKERKDLEQKIAQEKVLAEQKKLEEKEQEQQRLEQIKSSQAKVAEPTKKETMTAEEICESMVKNLEQLIQKAF